MTLTDIIKKLIVGVIIYASLAITPVSYRTEIKLSPAKDEASAITNLVPGTYISQPSVNQEPVFYQVNQEALPEPTKEAQDRWNSLEKSTIFLLYYPLGELGYAESKDPFQIPGDWIIQIKMPHGYNVQQWWDEQKKKPDIAYSKDLMQRMILAVNPPKIYPKDFPKKFNLWKEDIILPEGEIVNFIDFDHKGTVFGVIGQYLPKEEVAKILALKNDRGELLNGPNRR